MNLASLAESDLKITLEDSETGGAELYTLYSPKGDAYPVSGIGGDIGFLLDANGEPVQGRSIIRTCRISTVEKYETQDSGKLFPSKGWRAEIRDVNGKLWKTNVVRNEPDRALGVYRLTLSLDLEKADAGNN